jgi:predicted deacylase
VLAALVLAGVAGVAGVATAAARTVVVGHSVRGRAITAIVRGPDDAKRKILVVGCIHGNECAGLRITSALARSKPAKGVQLWIVPEMNPDGAAADTRQNAHGVDLNRNYPYKWKNLDGSYESGPKPASEPETRAMMRFLSTVKPAYILSFHQPLHAVDVTERPTFSKRVARALRLPMSRLTCGSTCHGTMTMWFNHKFRGFALTVEYGANPPKRKIRTAPGQILKLFGAWRGGVKGVPRS